MEPKPKKDRIAYVLNASLWSLIAVVKIVDGASGWRLWLPIIAALCFIIITVRAYQKPKQT